MYHRRMRNRANRILSMLPAIFPVSHLEEARKLVAYNEYGNTLLDSARGLLV